MDMNTNDVFLKLAGLKNFRFIFTSRINKDKPKKMNQEMPLLQSSDGMTREVLSMINPAFPHHALILYDE